MIVQLSLLVMGVKRLQIIFRRDWNIATLLSLSKQLFLVLREKIVIVMNVYTKYLQNLSSRKLFLIEKSRPFDEMRKQKWGKLYDNCI